jgi:hypothetical protein
MSAWITNTNKTFSWFLVATLDLNPSLFFLFFVTKSMCIMYLNFHYFKWVFVIDVMWICFSTIQVGLIFTLVKAYWWPFKPCSFACLLSYVMTLKICTLCLSPNFIITHRNTFVIVCAINDYTWLHEYVMNWICF